MDFQIIPSELNTVLKEIVDEYQKKTGKILSPAHIENSLIQVYAYRENLIREAINYAFLQNFPQFATGFALDLCGEPFGCKRLENENDEDYRKRILLAPESFTTCGTIGSYEFHARQASHEVADVFITHADNGIVEITILAKTGIPTSELINQVRTYVNDDSRRTLCDSIIVKPAEAVTYQINATLDLLKNVDEATVKKQASLAIKNWLAQRKFILGEDIVPLAIQQILKVDGVYNVNLSSPSLLRIEKNQFAKCTEIVLKINEERQDG